MRQLRAAGSRRSPRPSCPRADQVGAELVELHAGVLDLIELHAGVLDLVEVLIKRRRRRR